MTGSEVGERKYEEIRKRPQTRARTRDTPRTNALYVCTLPVKLLAPTTLRTLFIETNILVIIFFL